MNKEFLTDPITLKKLQQFAKARGGELISKNYRVQHEKLFFKCKFNHQFSQTAGNLKWWPNVWCGECSGGLGERMTRIAFQKIFKKKFPKLNPIWLRSKEDTPLELDGYNKNLRLAFEHRGLQYYKNKSFFHKNWKQSSKDRYLKHSKFKEKICKKNKVNLIIVPAVPEITHPLKLKYFIKKSLENSNNKYIKACLKKVDKLSIDYSMAYKFSHFETLKKIAKQKGGKVISKYFIGYTQHHEFQCKYRHKTFSNSARLVIERDQWCPNMTCVNEKIFANMKKKYPTHSTLIQKFKSPLKALHAIYKSENPNYALNRLSKKTIKNQKRFKQQINKIIKDKKAKIIEIPQVFKYQSRLKLRCIRGHIYEPSVHRLLEGKWCRRCWKINK